MKFQSISLLSFLLMTLPAAAACYDTPSGMTICPPVNQHLGPDPNDPNPNDPDTIAACLGGQLPKDSPACTARVGVRCALGTLPKDSPECRKNRARTRKRL